MQKTNIKLAEEKHCTVMGVLKGEMSLVRPNITKVTDTELAVTTARHRADSLIECVSDLDEYVVVDNEKIPKQPRDMTRYNTVLVKKTHE